MACCKCEEYGWEDPQSFVYTDPEDGKEYCLFHAPAEHKGMSVDEFNAQVSERIQAFIDLEGEKAFCELSGTIFPGDICFAPDSALPNISFRKASFGGTAIFDTTSFVGNAGFSETGFGGRAFFIRATFGVGAYFSATRFEQDAYFSSAQFNGPIRFKSIKTEDAILTFAHCTVSSSAMAFENCDPTCLDLVEQRDLTHIHFINSSWERNGRIKACTEDTPGRLQSTRDFYQRMKAKYKAENNEYEASKWHVSEKEAQLKLLGEEGESRFLWAMLWLYKLVSGFGEDPRRAFWVLLGLFALPLLVLTGIEVYQHFSWWDFDSARLNHVLKEWLKFIPLARAIGENEPGGWHALMLLWQLIITIQAALFAFALRNRFRR